VKGVRGGKKKYKEQHESGERAGERGGSKNWRGVFLKKQRS